LKACGLTTLNFRRIRGDIIETYKILSGKYDADVVLVPGTVSEGLSGWSEALTAGLAVWTAKTAKTTVTGSNFETQRQQPLPDS